MNVRKWLPTQEQTGWELRRLWEDSNYSGKATWWCCNIHVLVHVCFNSQPRNFGSSSLHSQFITALKFHFTLPPSPTCDIVLNFNPVLSYRIFQFVQLLLGGFSHQDVTPNGHLHTFQDDWLQVNSIDFLCIFFCCVSFGIGVISKRKYP